MEFEQAYKKYFDRVYYFVFRRVADYQEVEDIVSETFLAVWKNWDNIHSDKLTALIFTIARNKLNDFLRVKYKLAGKFSTVDIETIAEIYTSKSNNKKYLNILTELINELPERDKLIIKMRYKENKKFIEIANEIGATTNNIKVIHNRLIKKLKIKWQNYEQK